MDKNSKITGIDISKSSFDAYSETEGHQKFENTPSGFKKLLKKYGTDTHYVMESTGCYHLLLALYLSGEGVLVSVENPLKIKRYIQMQLMKVKTDKADARMICRYGMSQELKLWKAPDALHREGESLFSLLQFYKKQRTSLKNKLHREKALGIPSISVEKSLKSVLQTYNKTISGLEKELEKLVNTLYREELALLRSIPGIGPKTSILLVMLTDGMRNFESSGQLCSYAGLTPVIRESGKSVRSRPRISKMGNGTLRRHLFMCAFNAMKYNSGCKSIYDRLTGKGKSGKVGLIAVCNKLLKQSFGILKSRKPYCENFSPISA
ncbi:IS110 family transposase [Daejeonia sp. YH14]|uniref:IS110 family transposase n=1 Tax=Daejeonia sp. YH14 TaxID=3439042 RepID=UPI003F49A831